MRRFFHSFYFGAVFCCGMNPALVLADSSRLDEAGLHYQNYWGGQVFAPLAIVVGFLFALIGTQNWKKIVGPSPKLKGKAARDGGRAARTRFPIDTYVKW